MLCYREDGPNFAGILPEFAEIFWNSKSRRIRDASGTHPDASGRIRNRYLFRRNLHLANRPSFSARSCARPQAAALRDLRSVFLRVQELLQTVRHFALELVQRQDGRFQIRIEPERNLLRPMTHDPGGWGEELLCFFELVF